ncbi:Hypothetical protein D9617_6g095300 [Elsinoe fawcettii]|nr:Hypothetical protein D9617_6g095300 [Elsinoe fawcettii]
MSLNGLDSPEIVQTFTTAISEPAGWFLLKYVSRDTIELLGSGTSGVFEARTCMSSYEEKSPLYGLIMFRRKRVLIKYIPEGTSRLLQVRTAVHFKDVIEKYSPYDALLDITTTEGLSDTNLAATFPLHAGAASVSTNQLDEITEDAEEPASAPSRPTSASPAPTKMSRKAALDRMAAYKRSIPIVPKIPPTIQKTPETGAEAAQVDVSHADDAAHNESAGNTEEQATPIIIVDPVSKEVDEQTDQASIAATEPTLETSQLEQTDSIASASTSERPFSPSPYDPIRSDPDARPDSAVLKDIEIFDFRPKVKLGPRPVQIQDRKKAGQMPSMARRSTATLPARVQIRRQTTDTSTSADVSAPVANAMDDAMQERPTSSSSSKSKQQPALAASMDAPEEAMPTLPPIPSRPQSAASFRSGKGLRSKTPLTPEKQRLLKAVEMRKRQLRSQQASNANSPASSIVAAPAGVDPAPSVVEEPEHVETPSKLTRDAMASISAQSARKSDSGVEMSGEAVEPVKTDQDVGLAKEQVTEEDLPQIEAEPPVPDEGDKKASPDAAEEAPVPQESDSPGVDPILGADSDSPGVDPVLGAESPLPDEAVPSSPILPPTEDTPQDHQEAMGHHQGLGLSNLDESQTEEDTAAAEEVSQADDAQASSARAGSDDTTPPADRHQPSTFFTEADSTREVSLAPTDELNKTALYEDSVSTKEATQDPEAFFDTASEKSNRNTWLSDASELQDRPDSPDSIQNGHNAQRRKRRGIIAPLAIPAEQTPGPRTGSVDESDTEYFTTATVHEATSMAVLRSPATPVVAKKTSAFSMGSSPTPRAKTPPQKKITLERVKTSPQIPTISARDLDISDVKPTARRVKTATSSPVENGSPVEAKDLVASSRKNQLGSGISQRIAKLEQKSREGSPLPSPKALPTPPLSNGGLFNKNLFSGRPSSTASANPEMLKGRLRSIGLLSGNKEPVKPVATSHETNAYYTVHTDPNTRRQSVSVTAKIVRPNTRTYNEAPAVLETPSITFDSDSDYHSFEPPPIPAPREHSIASNASRKSADSSKLKRFSFHRAKSHESRLDSLSGSIAPPRPPSPLKQDVTPSSSKRDRTSRFLKRMSGLSAISRKHRSDIPPPSSIPESPRTPMPKSPALSTDKPLPPEPAFALHGFEPSLSPGMMDDPASPLPGIRIGDVNVQFPHSGLWKRRFLEIDAQGNLIVSLNDKSSYSTRHGNVPMSLYNTGGVSPARSGGKAWHLREIARIFVPHLDDMELAYSVVLELDGEEGEVVLACEDGRGQREVLNVLLKYHQAWSAQGA